MKTKNDYRLFFAECKAMLKMKYFCKLANINTVNFSRFMKSEDFNWCMSIAALDRLYNVVLDTLEKIA